MRQPLEGDEDGDADAGDQLIEVELDDDELAWELDPEGTWHRVPSTRGIDAHRVMQELAVQRAEADR